MGIEADRHLADDSIESYILGSLRREELDEADQHLLICDACRERVGQLDGYVRAMKDASQRLAETPKRHWNFRVLLPAFIFCALLITAAAVKYGSGRRDQPAEIALYSMRGNQAEARGPSRRPLLLKPDLRGLPAAQSYAIEMVNASGSAVWRGTVFASEGTALVPPQQRGVYAARVSLPEGALLREYALELRGSD